MRLPGTILLAAVLALGIGFSRSTLSAQDGALRGVVTDEAGKPIRGALVKATAGPNSVARFTDDTGRYEITGLKPVEYQVQASAANFAVQTLRRAGGGTGALNFSLKPRFDITRLSTSELLSALPENSETRFLRASCSGCHTMLPLTQKRGLQASEWVDVLQRMGVTTGLPFGASPVRMAHASQLLEKYFGPDGEVERIDPKAVKYAPLAPEVLKATFYEFRTPTYTKLIHSIAADSKGNAWFTGYDYQANRMAVVNLEKAEIKEFPIATPNSAPHTPLVDQKGLVWTTLADANRLLLIDPATNKLTEFEAPAKEWGYDRNMRLHTPAVDKEGNIWMSNGTPYVIKFDPRTQKWDRFAVAPVPPSSETQLAWGSAPGEERPAPTMAGTYHVEPDSKGRIWYTQLSTGTLGMVDPKTGQNRAWKVPGVISSRGIAIDKDDNIYFSNWDGHTIVRMDAKTETFKQFQPPTPYAAAYGMVFDNKGNLWYADYIGNNVTMFDPKAEKFIEYPLPTGNAMPRFISVDAQGRVWFTEWWHSKVGVLVPNGTAVPAQTAAR